MKSHIIEKITSTVGVSGSGLSLIDVDKGAEELQQLMCYREVKAIMSWHQFSSYPDYSMDLVYQLRDVYAPSLVISCIQKVKCEQP